MSDETVARALENDAPLTAAVHQRDIAHEDEVTKVVLKPDWQKEAA